MKKIANFILLTIFAAVIAFLAAQTALACSCMVSDTVDKDFVQEPNIAVFKVQSVEKYAEGEKGYGYGAIKQSKLTVEKVYKGNLKVGQVLTFAQGGGGDCIWTFDEESVGQEYLFYLGNKPLDAKSSGRVISSTTFGNLSPAQNVWAASICSRSGPVKYRTGDIKYFENIAKVRGKTRLSGTLLQYIPAITDDEEAKNNLLSGYKITVKGNGKNIELKTDSGGFYEIYDLPPGKYKITPEKISGYKSFWGESPDGVQVEIKAGSHTERDFTFSIDNRISGRFFDANGKPLEDVCLRLLPARGNPRRGFYEADCTDENGRFEIEEIPAGTYVIVVNDDDEISADEPFRKFYYPGALKREDAAEITIGAGEYRDDFIITAPETAEVITISGVLLFEGGKVANKENAEYASIEFIEESEEKKPKDDRDVASRTQIDEKGRFTIRILKGQKGKLFGTLSTYVGEYENCPKLDKLVRASGRQILDVTTEAVEIDAVSDLSGIVLKFPFPSCKKREIE
ncbi:MAG: carboxypeptidase-like regulatory domain-containing protein [Acidobacteriota bacterium]|nr:carboxypeptidase-like regulatory domain-containing protein [Acidobacteriota bacterium]